MLDQLITEINKEIKADKAAVQAWLNAKEIPEADITPAVIPHLTADFIKESQNKAIQPGKGFKPVKQSKQPLTQQPSGAPMTQSQTQTPIETQGVTTAQANMGGLLDGMATNFEQSAVNYLTARLANFFTGGGLDQRLCQEMKPIIETMNEQVRLGSERLQNSALSLGYGSAPVASLNGTTIDVEGK